MTATTAPSFPAELSPRRDPWTTPPDQQRRNTNARAWQAAQEAAGHLLESAAVAFVASQRYTGEAQTTARQRLNEAAHAYALTVQAHRIAIDFDFLFSPIDVEGLPTHVYVASLKSANT